MSILEICIVAVLLISAQWKIVIKLTSRFLIAVSSKSALFCWFWLDISVILNNWLCILNYLLFFFSFFFIILFYFIAFNKVSLFSYFILKFIIIVITFYKRICSYLSFISIFIMYVIIFLEMCILARITLLFA
jgi:hypothetical protein